MENGKTVAQVTQPKESVVDLLRGLLKDAPSGITAGAIREERLGKMQLQLITVVESACGEDCRRFCLCSR